MEDDGNVADETGFAEDVAGLTGGCVYFVDVGVVFTGAAFGFVGGVAGLVASNPDFVDGNPGFVDCNSGLIEVEFRSDFDEAARIAV